MDADDETRSLLQSTGDARESEPRRFDAKTTRRYFVCVFILKFMIQFIAALLELPAVGLFEAAICREYYQKTHVRFTPDKEAMCKLPTIQNKLALVMGLKVAFDAIPGLLTSIWYGTLANRKGRRTVLALAATGDFLAWSWVVFVCLYDHGLRVEYAWLGSLFFFIGGGNRLLLGILFTTCADVVPWKKRSQVLFFLHAMTHFARMLAPPLAALMMDNHLWVPFALALSLQLCRLLLIYFLPETLPSALDARYAKNSDSLQAPPQEISPQPPLSPPSLPSVKRMISHPSLILIFASFIVKRIAFSSEGLTFQYASEKMDKKLHQTAWLRISNTIGATLVLSTVLPLISHYGPWKSPRKDLLGMRASLSIAVVGFLIIFTGANFAALCAGMGIAGLAEGLEPSLQALGTYIVGELLHANFFSFVSMLDLIGEILGGPVMGGVYRIRDASGHPAGYTFLLSAILFAVLFCTTWFVRLYTLRQDATVSNANGDSSSPILPHDGEE